MIGAALTRWLVATLLAVLLGSTHLLDQDPEALQAVADEAASIAQDAQRMARVDAALQAQGKQRP